MNNSEGGCMENRDRDKVSQRTSPTEAGNVNRKVEEEKGREHNKGTSAEFGQNVGRSENLEGGSMRNRDDKGMSNIDRSSSSEVNESSRRPGSSYDSSTGRSGSDKSSGSDRLRDDHITRDDLENSGNSGSMGTPPKDKDSY
jgi:hypothetical protein